MKNKQLQQTVPSKVQEAMLAGGSMVTCIPVQFDEQAEWESAIFFRLHGKESETDLKILIESKNPLPLSIETDLIEHENASVVVLRVEVETVKDDPLCGEILLTSGGADAHFEALKLLSTQARLCWFFTDESFAVIHSQSHLLHDEQRAEFASLLKDASNRDAVIRMSGKYSAHEAFASIVKHYDFRVRNA